MALTNDRERKICAKYSRCDEEGFVRCDKCPLAIPADRTYNGTEVGCKAWMHYDRSFRMWVSDDDYKTIEEEIKSNE